MNQNILYIAIVVGVVVAIIGIVLLALGHHRSAYAALVFGILLIVAGVTAIIVARRGMRQVQ